KKAEAQEFLARIEGDSQKPVIVYDCPGEHAGWVREPAPGKCPMCEETLVMREEMPRGIKIANATVDGMEFKMIDDKPPLYYGFLGGTLIGVTDEGLLKTIVARFKAGRSDGSLATDPAFIACRDRVGGDSTALLFFIASANRIIDKFMEEGDEESERIVDAFGLRTIEGFAIGAAIEPGGVVKEGVYLHAPGERKGITKLPSYVRPCELDLAMTPPNAMAAGTMDVDFTGLYDEVMNIIKGAAGEEWPEVEADIREFEEKAGLNIRNDLICSLGGRVHLASMPLEGGGLLPSGFYVIDLKDSARFERAINSLVTYGEKCEIRTMPFKGREIKYFSRLPQKETHSVIMDDMNSQTARMQIETFQIVIEQYRLQNGAWPETIEALAPDMLSEIPLDPWGNQYVYEFPGKEGEFDLTSFGADGQPGGDGAAADLTNHNMVGYGSESTGPTEFGRHFDEEEMFGLAMLGSLPNCYFIKDNRCFFGPMAQGLKDVIRMFEAGVLPAPSDGHALATKTASIPKGTLAPQYSDLRPFVGALYNTLLQGLTVAEPIIEVATPMPFQFDTATMPSASAITRHLDSQLSWGLSDKGGISYHITSSSGITTLFVGALAMAGAVSVPYMIRARGQAREIVCINNLRQIGMCIIIYRDQHGEGVNFPPGTGREFLHNLMTLPTPEKSICVGMESSFRCPTGDPLPPGGISYRGPVQELKSDTPFEIPIVCDSPANHSDGTICVLYLDGHVETHYPGTPQYIQALEMTKE
ncbi:MAG: type II secretion system protein GspG, partial [Planctomycetota bacterium]|nr:type II secretion system protein GspG [Planctomycetota bacterium]